MTKHAPPQNGTGYRASRRSGLTLIELLLVLVMTVLLVTALTFAFSAEINMQRLTNSRQTQTDHSNSMERQITQYLEGARLSAVTTDTTSYFQGTNDGAGSDLGCDRITFTTTSPGIPMVSMKNTEDDFETQHAANGPVGGLTEISLGTSPVGDAGDQVGLFQRLQHPSDSDPTQGGFESVLDPDIASIGFQFWDGLEWVQTWDTTAGSRRLPQAVQVSYTLKNTTSNTPNVFVVPILASDVTAQNPYTGGQS